MTPIKCYLCGHRFDTSYQIHCKCRGCGKSISVADAHRAYRSSVANPIMASGPAAQSGPGPAVPPPAVDPLGPALRDKDGKPLPKPTDPRPAQERPRYASEDFSFIAQRAKKLRQERDERVARGEGEELL